jgi:hypothetical protein
MLRDLRAQTPATTAARDLIVASQPDVLLILHFDHDYRLEGLRAFQQSLDAAGHAMPHAFSLPPNTGLPTGLDMDGDGRTGQPDDAQAWGQFQGARGMALLSRYPFGDGFRDLSRLLWRDLPGARYPPHDGPVPPLGAQAIQRLSTSGHWDVPVLGPEGQSVHLLAWHAGPPAFGRVSGRNRDRNHDETLIWARYLDGVLPLAPPTGPVVLIGNANLDPARGDGDHAAIRDILDYPRLQDPQPMGARHPDGDRSAATADYALPPQGPGALRSSYILPDSTLRVVGSGLVWPALPARHALVWIDLEWPPP